jgi:hypothetical protein
VSAPVAPTATPGEQSAAALAGDVLTLYGTTRQLSCAELYEMRKRAVAHLAVLTRELAKQRKREDRRALMDASRAALLEARDPLVA